MNSLIPYHVPSMPHPTQPSNRSVYGTAAHMQTKNYNSTEAQKQFELHKKISQQMSEQSEI